MNWRSISWALMLMFAALLLAHFVLVFSALLLPLDWQLPVLITAIGFAVVAIVLGLAARLIDCCFGEESIWDLLESMAVMGLVIGPAAVLEKTHDFNWWLTAGATAAVVMPLWWLSLKARGRPKRAERSHPRLSQSTLGSTRTGRSK
jgi:hypothetical protein